VHFSLELARVTAQAGEWIMTQSGYAAALLLPAIVVGVADWLVRRRRS